MKICSKCNKENDNTNGDYCVFCGEKLINKEKIINSKNKEKTSTISSNKLQIIIIILILIIFFLCGVIIYLYCSNNTSELENKVSSLKSQVTQIKKEKNKLSTENDSLKSTHLSNSKKITFFDENIVFILDGYGNYYYTYDQMSQVTQGNSFSYWAYNKEQAINLGYKAWK